MIGSVGHWNLGHEVLEACFLEESMLITYSVVSTLEKA